MGRVSLGISGVPCRVWQGRPLPRRNPRICPQVGWSSDAHVVGCLANPTNTRVGLRACRQGLEGERGSSLVPPSSSLSRSPPQGLAAFRETKGH